MNLFYQPQLGEDTFELEHEEALHAIKVLRQKVGDKIQITDGKGSLVNCTITSISGKKCLVEVNDKRSSPKPSHEIHIALSPTKSSDRYEWFIEKATELGVQKISFLHTEHGERKKINLERAIKVSISAMKKSGQLWLPQLSDMTSFKKILSEKADQKFIAHVDSTNTRQLFQTALKNKSYLVLIGPEGDFSSTEINQAHQNGFVSVGLGKHTLRTETAGVAACHILNLIQP